MYQVSIQIVVSGLPGGLETEVSPRTASVQEDKSRRCTPAPKNFQVRYSGRGMEKQ